MYNNFEENISVQFDMNYIDAMKVDYFSSHGYSEHRHPKRKIATTPSTNAENWVNKFSQYIERDKHNEEQLKQLGRNFVVILKYEIMDQVALPFEIKRIPSLRFLKKNLEMMRVK